MMNFAKTTFLMAAMMGLVMGVAYLLGGTNFLLPALMLGAVFNFIAFFFSDKLALASMRAKEVTRNDDPKLYDMVARLAERGGLPMPRVYISAMAAPNAFATGRNPSKGVVCVTAGLRQMLNDDELAGVISHELGHIKHRDILISTLAAIMGAAITYLAHIAMFTGGGRGRDGGGVHPLALLLMMILAPLAAMLIQMAISRSREYGADAFGAALCGKPRALAGALAKLQQASTRVPMPVSPAQSNMFIVHPLSAEGASALFRTHPPTQKRIERLMEMERELSQMGQLRNQ
jgi:heat shock protein HtpX